VTDPEEFQGTQNDGTQTADRIERERPGTGILFALAERFAKIS